jgi:serine/threonine protein phosphatase PrpC
MLCDSDRKTDMGSYHESRENRRGGRRNRAASTSFRAAGLTDAGCERSSNEDRFLIFVRDDMAGYFVFDGMGGQPAGEAAAQISADVITRALHEFREGDLRLFMSYAIELAQEELLSRRGDPSTEGMGTTVVGVVTRGSELVIGAVGDSRAYHIRRGAVTQVTSDHTLVQQLVDAGQISPHDALVHPQSHILTRCLGSTFDFAVDSSRYQLSPLSQKGTPDEWLLLCSDGLYSLVSDEEMAAIVFNFPPEEATQKLIAFARSRGGFDNITAVVIPLDGRVEELSEDAFPSDSLSRPDSPQDLIARSEFCDVAQFGARRFSLWRYAWTVAVLSALALIVTAVWVSLFTVRQG